MEMVGTAHMTSRQRHAWQALLQDAGLHTDEAVDYTVLLWEDGQLAATGSRAGNIFKYFTTAPQYRERGFSAAVMTELRQEAFSRGIGHLFLYTKPENGQMFTNLCFYPVARTADILLMESCRGGIGAFVASLPKPPTPGVTGAAVMHCDPFTRGHRYLLGKAARDCEWLYVFVVSEDKGRFPAADRIELVRRGTADLPNVIVCPTGPYLISQVTFPTYFLRDTQRADDIRCHLDMEIFASHFAPALHITRRYVGTEPFSPVTAAYNRAMEAFLPGRGIEVREIPRKAIDGTPISASAVRALLGRGQAQTLHQLVPETTWRYLQQHRMIGGEEDIHDIP